MKRIDLYIAGSKADLNEQSLVLMNYTAKELSSPTAVKNSYTQAVKLPATPANNKIFSHILRSDYRTTTGAFNPLVRTPFELRDELGAIVESGYLKLDEGESGKEYSVTLYGGLGSFFYSLMYKADGEKMNLGDLVYVGEDATYNPNGNAQGYHNINIKAAEVADFFNMMTGSDDYDPQRIDWSFFFGFAPAYNGIPENFDANKVLVYRSQFLGIYDHDGGMPKSGYECYLVKMENKHESWEMRDLRCYLQTPIVKIAEVLKAVSVPGYTFTASEDVYSLVENLWMSLGQIKRAASYTAYPMADLFEASPAPAEVLIGLVKTFGLVFDVGPGKVEMMTREKYYQQGRTIDINKRVDLSKGIRVQPISFDTKYYVWKNGLVESGYVKEYRERYGKEYGEQLVNTGTEFNNERTEALEGLVFKGAVMDAKVSHLMRWQRGNGQFLEGNFIPTLTEKVTYQPYNLGQTPMSPVEVTFNTDLIYPVEFINADYPGYDITEKALFDDGGKPLSSAGVLLYYAGKKELPFANYGDYRGCKWLVTEDNQQLFDDLNDGVPCWCMSEDVVTTGTEMARRIYKLPIFSRYANGKSLDFGMLKETPVPWLNPYNFTPIYAARWEDYIADIYDVDSKTMHCTVNFSGIAVDAALLCHFYEYDNAVWVLNKIINYDAVNGGLVECEFIKVKNRFNYQ